MNNQQEIIKKIKSTGYWEINIHPYRYVERAIESRSKVKEVVYSSVVSLRGWNFPHLQDRTGEPYLISNGVEKYTDLDHHIEFWRMTQSGNYYHLMSLREDYMDTSYYNNIWSNGGELKGKKLLGTLNTLYTIVEIFEFSKRLVTTDSLSDEFVVEIALHDVLGRELYVDASRRTSFLSPRQCKEKKPWKYSEILTPDQINSNVEELSLKAYLDLIELFNWTNPPIEVFKDDVRKFLSGQI